ncbi:hypothetical protein Syun_004131 [Stephania yunnanensis]|uniref:Uncharacterized protein n=1 Tax=Stephania yunnanensis TaxID=152371 RepID=A0AAP0L6L2_9MAGN
MDSRPLYDRSNWEFYGKIFLIGGIEKVTECILSDVVGINTCEEMLQKSVFLCALFSHSSTGHVLRNSKIRREGTGNFPTEIDKLGHMQDCTTRTFTANDTRLYHQATCLRQIEGHLLLPINRVMIVYLALDVARPLNKWTTTINLVSHFHFSHLLRFCIASILLIVVKLQTEMKLPIVPTAKKTVPPTPIETSTCAKAELPILNNTRNCHLNRQQKKASESTAKWRMNKKSPTESVEQ